MSRDLVIRPEAEDEIAEAFDWYEDQMPGLGSAFLLAVEAMLESVRREPRRYPAVFKTVRQALTRRFPCKVLYVPEEDRRLTPHRNPNPRRT